MLGKRQFERCLFILIVKRFDKRINQYLSENPSSPLLIIPLLFQIVVLLFLIVNFKELLRVCFLGFHIVSHNMLTE